VLPAASVAVAASVRAPVPAVSRAVPLFGHEATPDVASVQSTATVTVEPVT
jgi:hypothetical protein